MEFELKKLLLLYPFAVNKEQIQKLLGLSSRAEVNKWLSDNGLTVDVRSLTNQEANRLLTKSIPVVYISDLVADELVSKELGDEKV